MRVGLVGCVKTKRRESSPDRDLYVSPLFLGRRAHVERTCDEWFVLSAEHGLVRPDTVLAPYDLALTSASSRERRSWALTVIRQLREQVGDLSAHEFEIHAGAAYRDFGLVEGLVEAGAVVTVPAEGLGQGQQLAYYAGRPAPAAPDGSALTARPVAPRAPSARRSGSPSGKYTPLGAFLLATDSATVPLDLQAGRRSPRRSAAGFGAHLPGVVGEQRSKPTSPGLVAGGLSSRCRRFHGFSRHLSSASGTVGSRQRRPMSGPDF